MGGGNRYVTRVSPDKSKEKRLIDRPWRKWKEYEIYLLPAIGLAPGDISTVHIYTKTIHRTTQLTNWEE